MNVTLQWFPLIPVGFALGLAVALGVLLAYGSWLLRRKSVPRRWIVALGCLRIGMIVLFLIGMLRPVVSFPRTVAVTPDVLVLVDSSESMSLPSASGQGTRFDEVRTALEKSPAVEAAGRSQKLHWFTFDRRAWPVASADLKQSTPQGTGTDFATSLRSAYQDVRLRNAAAGTQGTPARALVVSDGRDEGTNDVIAVARELGMTIDVLAPAANSKDSASGLITIADVQSARRVLLGSETAFQVIVRSNGAAGDDVALVLEEDGREVQRIKAGVLPVGQETRLMLSHHPAEPGLRRFTVKALHGDAVIGQPRAVNVRVTDQRHDVLVLEDSWRWEFKYLRRLLEDDPSFNLTALVSRGGSAFVHFGEPDRKVQLGGFPNSRSELDGFDTIVLGNVNPRNWPRGFARHLHNAVTEDGKSLVVLAGPQLGNWLDVPELTQILPVELTRDSGTPASGQIDLRITPEGHAATWFSMLPGRSSGEPAPGASSTPQTLPPLEHIYPAMRKRPAAAILLEATTQSNAYGPLIVMAEQTSGKGRVLFVATDTLWRWQTLGPRSDAGVTLYSAFWQQALRGLAPAEPTSSSARLWLRPERTLYRAGDKVRLAAQWETDSASAETGPEPLVSATVVLPDGRRLPLDLTPQQDDPRRMSGQFDVTAPGQYRIEATARTDARQLAEMATKIEVVSRPGEKDFAPVDAAALERVAAATGGRVIDPAAADGWLKANSAEPATVVRRQSYDLWHNFTVLLALSALLAADWTMRLFRGYV